MSITVSQAGLVAGGAIFAVLGTLHAYYTYRDESRPRFLVPDDPQVIEAMARSHVRLSRGGTTMWRAWLGFNYSHSIGAILFGVACIATALLLRDHSPPRAALFVPVAIGCLYALLAVRYWFRIPLAGIAIATACFAAAWMGY
jgi:hypothetical protein